MDIRKGNDVNVYFELSKLGVPSAESIKSIRCFFVKDVRSESGGAPIPPSLNPSSYVIHDHMHPCYNVHMPYLNIDGHVHREFSVPCGCVPGWYNPNIFFTTDYKIVDIEKEGQDVSFLKTVFNGSKQRNGRYNVILEIAFIEQGVEDGTQTKCTFDYGHQFDIIDQPDAASGIVNIWIGDDRDVSVRLDEEILRATTAEEELRDAIEDISVAVEISEYFSQDTQMPYGNGEYYTYGGKPVEHRVAYLDGDDYEIVFCIKRGSVNEPDICGQVEEVSVFQYNSEHSYAEWYDNYGDAYGAPISEDYLALFAENLATDEKKGLMSAEDKAKLNTIATLSSNNKITVLPGNDVEIKPTYKFKVDSSKPNSTNNAKQQTILNVSATDAWITKGKNIPINENVGKVDTGNVRYVEDVSSYFVDNTSDISGINLGSNNIEGYAKDFIRLMSGSMYLWSNSTLKIGSPSTTSIDASNVHINTGGINGTGGGFELEAHSQDGNRSARLCLSDNLLEFQMPQAEESTAIAPYVQASNSTMTIGADTVNINGGKTYTANIEVDVHGIALTYSRYEDSIHFHELYDAKYDTLSKLRGCYNVVTDLNLSYNESDNNVDNKLNSIINTRDYRDIVYVAYPRTGNNAQDISTIKGFRYTNKDPWHWLPFKTISLDVFIPSSKRVNAVNVCDYESSGTQLPVSGNVNYYYEDSDCDYPVTVKGINLPVDINDDIVDSGNGHLLFYICRIQETISTSYTSTWIVWKDNGVYYNSYTDNTVPLCIKKAYGINLASTSDAGLMSTGDKNILNKMSATNNTLDVTIGNTTLTLDETKLQRLAQLLN